MSRPTDLRILEVKTDLEQIDYRTPIKFGGRVVKDVTLLNVHVEVETRDGRRGRGLGSMPMGNAVALGTDPCTEEVETVAVFIPR